MEALTTSTTSTPTLPRLQWKKCPASADVVIYRAKWAPPITSSSPQPSIATSPSSSYHEPLALSAPGGLELRSASSFSPQALDDDLYALIYDFVHESGMAWTSIDTIAERTSISVNTVEDICSQYASLSVFESNGNDVRAHPMMYSELDLPKHETDDALQDSGDPNGSSSSRHPVVGNPLGHLTGSHPAGGSAG